MTSRSLRILVVDDDPAMVGAITALVGTEGHQVITAYDGLTAVKRFRDEHPDLVLLDLAMPGPDGFSVAGQMRAVGQAPILVVSGESGEAAKVRALGIGADDYLTKPFGMGELLARLRAVLRRAGAPQDSVLHVGDVAIDLARHVVTRSGKEIHLTPTEYDLLRVLATDADKVLTHRQLLERVWGGYAAENTQQLRVYINYLRRKLEADPTRPQLLVTEPGVGYRLKADPAITAGTGPDLRR
jgi:two-component system, OmpR family, KDP operon response regulator KdpE